MKKVYSAIICLFPLFALAQPTITQSELPVIGTTWQLAKDPNYIDAIQAGGAGATWTYTTLLNTVTDSLAFQDAILTPYTGLFPTANLAHNDIATGFFQYYTTDFTGLYANGSSNSGVAIDSMSPPLLILPVPFTFSDFTNSVSTSRRDSSDGINCIHIFKVVSSNIIADGWGTLTTPAGTFPNVLRVLTTETTVDSTESDFFCLGFILLPGTVTANTITRFRYYTAGTTNSYLLGINADATGTTATSSEYLLNPMPVSVNNLQGNSRVVTLYPNPANDKVRVVLNGNNSASTGKNSMIKIYDSMSRMVYSRNIDGLTTLDIPVSTFDGGLYFYSLSSDNGTNSGKFTVAH